ncbi:MAG: fibronectin type III domain-containing protein [Acidobacteriota bacterium]
MKSPFSARRRQRRIRSLAAIGLLVAAMAACGKKGNPLPPLRPVPARIADLTVVRTRDRITLHFTVPGANVDGSTPAAIDRVDIYRVILPPGATPAAAAATPTTVPAMPGVPAATVPPAATTPATPATAPAVPATTQTNPAAATPAATPASPAAPAATLPGQAAASAGRGRAGGAAPAVPTGPTAATVIADPKNLLTRVAVRRTPKPDTSTEDASKPPKSPAPAVPPDPRPESGSVTTFVDPIDASAVAGSTRYYVAVPVVGNGRGRPGAASALIAVPLGDLPQPPTDIALKFDETRVTATWAPVAGETFTVLRTGEALDLATAELLTPEPIASSEFSLPSQFGKAVCLAVKATKATGPVRVEGLASAPVCVTPVDRFPPPAPGGLQAVQEGAAVTLIWTSVDAPDLAGYVVLRGDGATGTLQPLMRVPIRETTYRDTTAQPGQTYTYAVYAADSSPAANVSQLSDRQTIVMR